MQTTIAIIGTLRSWTLEYKGQSNFPVGKLELSLGQDFLQLDATGPMAETVNAMIGEAQGEPRLQATARVTARQSQDGDIYTGLELIGLAPTTQANLGAAFSFVGIIGELSEKQGRSSTFTVPVLNLIGADRTAVLPQVPVEMSFTRSEEEAQKAAWKNGYGMLGEISGQVTAFVSNSGRAYPKYRIESVSVSPLPDYLAGFGPQAATDPALLAGDAAATGAVI